MPQVRPNDGYDNAQAETKLSIDATDAAAETVPQSPSAPPLAIGNSWR